MDISFNAEHEAYRESVRAFLAANWQKTRDQAAIKAFRRLAIEAGYLYRSIPRAYGGSEQAADVIRAHIIREEFGRAGAPREVSGNGAVGIIVPTLLENGAEWQKEKFIEATLYGDINWCQGYSEPGAGSDLASIKTRAELVDGHWVINGQKIWTSMAQHADYMFMLVRTEPDQPKHGGISYLLLDMKSPGIDIRPIHQITGAREFCEVFFDNVKTPADWIVGPRGEGWRVSRSTLKHERNSAGSSTGSLALYQQLLKLAKSVVIDGRPATQDPLIRDRLMKLEGAVQAHVCSGYYQLTRDAHDKDSGLLSVMNKMIFTDINHEVAAIANDIIGSDGLLMPGDAAVSFGEKKGAKAGNEKWMNQILSSLAMAMGGGTSNIQRNIIASRGLDLPKSD